MKTPLDRASAIVLRICVTTLFDHGLTPLGIGFLDRRKRIALQIRIANADGQHKRCIIRNHHVGGFFVEVGAVLNRIDPAKYAVADAAGAVAMRRDRAPHHMRYFGYRRNLVHRQLTGVNILTRRGASAGRHQLYQIGTGFDLLARRLPHFIGTVGFAGDEVCVPARHRNHASREFHPRSRDEAAIDGAAQRHLDVLLAADITNRCHAVREYALTDIDRFQYQVIAVLFEQGEDAFAEPL